MSALHPLTGAHLRQKKTSENSLASLAKISNLENACKWIICIMCINHIHFTRIGRLKNSPGRPVGTSPDM